MAGLHLNHVNGKAIALGVVVAFVLSNGFTLLITFSINIALILAGTPYDQITIAQISRVIMSSDILIGLLIFFEQFSIMLGGFFSAWTARKSELKHGVLVGIMVELLGISIVIIRDLFPLHELSLFFFLLTIPSAFVGAYLGRQYNTAKQA
ncbi:MAG: hypothetical protein D6733_03670 [Methanobacteriota archaeon]|nr:MAG: hypothetical protein D6733_03670 [Euryarchaeota archaeon]